MPPKYNDEDVDDLDGAYTLTTQSLEGKQTPPYIIFIL